MNLIFRVLWGLIRGLWIPKVKFGNKTSIFMRVLPNDLDFNAHMNNGRFLTIMDIGRMNLILSTEGMFKLLVKKRWSPILGSASIKYRKPLDAFVKYELVTQVVYWDEKWWYIEHQFKMGDTICAIALVKGLFIGKGRSIPTKELLSEMNIEHKSPEMPESIAQWKKYEEILSEKVRK